MAIAPAQPIQQQPREASVPVPMLGEGQSQFFDRAMRALRRQVPSVNRRTVEVLKIWCSSINDQDLRDKAFMQFPEDQYKHYSPRCIFLEHTVPASADGSREEIVYDRPALQQLVEWANYRIRNSDNFAAISDGHTPTADEKKAGHKMPEVLGYEGPFYLGQLGDVDPKWAIYADEWVHTEDVPRFDKLQRRSPEVWVNEPIESRTMDPIAALGAETPRLDSGMNPYCRRSTDDREIYRELSQGEEIMRYSASFDESKHPRDKGKFASAGEADNQQHAEKMMGERIAEAGKHEKKRDAAPHESPEYWKHHDQAIKWHHAAEQLMPKSGRSITLDEKDQLTPKQLATFHAKKAAENSAGNDLHEKVLGYVKQHGEVHLNEVGNGSGKYLADMRDDLGHPKVNRNKPGDNPVHKAVRELLQSGHLKHEDGSYGSGTVRHAKDIEPDRHSMAAAFPGPANTNIPGSEKGRKQQYGESAMPNTVDANRTMWGQVDANEGRRKNGKGYAKGRMKGNWHQSYAADADDANTDGGEQPSLEDAVGEALQSALQSLMPSLVQSVVQTIQGGNPDDGDDADPSQDQPGENEPVPMPEDEKPDDSADDTPRGMAPPEPEPEPAPPAKPPGDDEDARYKAQGPAIYGAYCAGKKSTMKYARPRIDESMHKRLAKLESDNRKLSTDIANERQDAMRYARLNELSREHEFDPKEEMETVLDMTEPQFERHCNVTIKRYSKRDDITNLQIYDDPRVQVDQYGRGRNNGPSAAQIEQYSRQAANIAATKNTSGTPTTWQAEYDALVAKDYPSLAAS